MRNCVCSRMQFSNWNSNFTLTQFAREIVNGVLPGRPRKFYTHTPDTNGRMAREMQLEYIYSEWLAAGGSIEAGWLVVFGVLGYPYKTNNNKTTKRRNKSTKTTKKTCEILNSGVRVFGFWLLWHRQIGIHMGNKWNHSAKRHFCIFRDGWHCLVFNV